MPFLRFSRDKRGYETIALMHAFRVGGRAQPRILYWFRGPVEAKVGRAAIDEDAIRLIEERYGDVSFDWPRILRTGPAVEAQKARPLPSTQPPQQSTQAGGSTGAIVPPVSAGGEPASGGSRTRRRSRRRRRSLAEAKVVSDAETPAARAAEAGDHPLATAAEESFSPEDLTRLRGRHAALLARIDREVADTAAAEGLRSAADALNPDTWVTPGDVTAALEHYESTYRRLLDALGPRQRTAPPEDR